MAATGFGKSAGITTGLIMGGFLCLGLFLLAIAATIILSLISIYLPNHGQPGYGEEYRFNALMLKVLYTDVGSKFAQSIINDNPELSALCGTQLSTKSQIKNFLGCVLQNGEAWGPYNNSASSRRRRQQSISNAGLYAIYEGRLFFGTKCPKTSDDNKTDNSSGLSSCVRQRLGFCNSIVNSNAANVISWATSVGASLEIDGSSGQESVAADAVYGVPRGVAGALGNSLGLGGYLKQELVTGCQYIGGVSLANITSILIAQTLAANNQTNSTSG